MCESVCSSMNGANGVGTCVHPLVICYLNLPHADKCCEMEYFGWDPPGMGRDLIMLVTSGILALSILFLHEFRIFTNIIFVWSGYKKYAIKHIPPETRDMDPDVEAEKIKVRKLRNNEYKTAALVSKDLCKFYNKYYAVKRLCLTIDT